MEFLNNRNSSRIMWSMTPNEQYNVFFDLHSFTLLQHLERSFRLFAESWIAIVLVKGIYTCVASNAEQYRLIIFRHKKDFCSKEISLLYLRRLLSKVSNDHYPVLNLLEKRK